MKNLLYKEFRLVITPIFYFVLLCGVLLLIPQWPYLIAPMYFFFIALPNIFSMSKAQNDIGFSAMLPVRRKDIVAARIASITIFEILQVLVTAVFAVINIAIYHNGNFMMETNAIYLGCVFMMFGVFNIVFFPMFYKTGYKLGVPFIAAIFAAMLFSAAAEFIVACVPGLKVHAWNEAGTQLLVLLGGIAVFILLNLVALKLSVKKFEKIDL